MNDLVISSDPLLSSLGLLLWACGSVLLLMALLQLVRADFYNPIVQVLVKVTWPILRPLQLLLPKHERIHFAAIILCVAFFAGAVSLAFYDFLELFPPVHIAIVSARLLFATLLDIFTVTLIVHAIMSWFGPKAYFSPAGRLFAAINEPLVAPIRRLVANKLGGGVSGMDFSPMIVLLLIFVTRRLLGLSFFMGVDLWPMVYQYLLTVAA